MPKSSDRIERPWTSPVQPIANNIVETITFPTDDESVGMVSVCVCVCVCVIAAAMIVSGSYRLAWSSVV